MTNTLPPAHWAADPSGRHEYRYWDGARWTDHVADRGAQGRDPLGDTVEATAETTSETTPDTTANATSVTPTPTPAPQAADAVVVVPPPPAPGTGQLGRGPAGSWSRDEWSSMDGLRTALVVLFACVALASVALLATRINRMAATDDFERTSSFANLQALRDADDAVDSAGSIHSALMIAIAVCFVIWQFRGAKNIEALRRDGARFSPGWSIGGWFIPLANFVIPVMIVQGFWRATAPGTQPGTRWKDGRRSVLVGFWWAALLLSGVANFTFNDDKKLDDVRTSDRVSSFGSVMSLVAACLAIALVVQLTRRFDERRAESIAVDV